jgi:hypothetical protein
MLTPVQVEWYAHFGFKPLGDRAFLVGDPAIDVHFWALCT